LSTYCCKCRLYWQEGDLHLADGEQMARPAQSSCRQLSSKLVNSRCRECFVVRNSGITLNSAEFGPRVGRGTDGPFDPQHFFAGAPSGSHLTAFNNFKLTKD
jgi:hypothetical protein